VTLWRGAVIGWVVMAVAASANGIFRVIVLEPRLGAKMAGVISAISAVAIIQLIAFLAVGGQRVRSWRQLAAVAIAWLLLTIAFEVILGRYVDRKSWTELVADYNLLEGRLWPVVLASVFAAPFVWGRVGTARSAVAG
jgi:hypothetical protein